MTDKKKVPINTAREANERPFERLAMAAVLGQSASIEHEEAQGQKSFVNSETLPSKMSYADKVALEKGGVKFGDRVEGDEIFQYVELPKSWKKVPTDHSMWSRLVDDKGHERASIFYKAAFYDRDAHLSTRQRYNFSLDYERYDPEDKNQIPVAVATVTDCGNTIHTTPEIPIGERKRWEVKKEVEAIAMDWLDNNFPDWKDAGAYWD